MRLIQEGYFAAAPRHGNFIAAITASAAECLCELAAVLNIKSREQLLANVERRQDMFPSLTKRNAK